MSTPDLIEVPATSGVRAYFMTRRLDGAPIDIGTTGGDLTPEVRDNRERLCAALGLDAARVTMGHQVHGDEVHEVTGGAPGAFVTQTEGTWPQRDGMVTAVGDLPLAIVTADCVPILMWRRDGTRVAAVHAGWRGLMAGAVTHAVEQIADPDAIVAAVGPCAGVCCYQVDDRLRADFSARFGAGVRAGDRVDLASAAARALHACGVREIVVDGSCTICDPRFFSYRREGAAAGRQGALIWREQR